MMGRKKKWLIAIPVAFLGFGAVSCNSAGGNDSSERLHETCSGTTYHYQVSDNTFWESRLKTIFEPDAPRCGGKGTAAKDAEKKQLEDRLKELEGETP